MKSVIVSILIGFFFIAPPIEEEKIIWQENRKLTWADFRGVPNRADSFVASTNSGISFSFSLKESEQGIEVDYTVLSNFYPDLSWHRPDRVNEYILQHEQTHFDISELFARKLRMKLESIEDLSKFRELSEEYYTEIEFERRQMQRDYDSESDHSNNRTKEFEWREYVAAQLNDYEDWK